MFEPKSEYNKEEIIACGMGELFPKGGPPLPVPPMLMFDRYTKVSKTGGKFDKGEMVAELDIKKDLWFFDCHFVGDPVMPGCLGLDAMWQMLGFYLGWLGHLGKGRALGCGEVKFRGQVLPDAKMVEYRLDMRRFLQQKLIMGIADGELRVDGKLIYTAKDLRVGLFKDDQML